MKRSDRFFEAAKAVVVFRDEYLKLVDALQVGPRPGTMTMTSLQPMSGKEQFATDQYPVVARAAGRAHSLASSSIGQVVVQQFGQVQVLDPVSSWAHSLDDPQRLPPKTVLETCEAAIGVLEAKAEEARRTEGTIAGRVAGFVGFPANVRAIVAQEHPELAKVAFGAGVIGQVAIGLFITVIGGALLAGAAKLVTLMFS